MGGVTGEGGGGGGYVVGGVILLEWPTWKEVVEIHLYSILLIRGYI